MPSDDAEEVTLATARSMSHGEQLARIARKYPERTALVCVDETRTFSQLDQRVTRLARALRQRGLGRGDRLAVLMGNSLEMVEAIFAGWRLGALVVPVNFRLVAEEVQFILGDCGARALVVDEGLAPLVAKVRESLPSLATLIVNGAEPTGAGPGAERYEDVLAAAEPDPLPIVVDENEAALICYTSGTSGRPKGAVLTHFNLFMSTLAGMIVQGVTAYDDVWYGNLPLFHIGGLSGILPYFIGGGRCVIVPSTNFDPAAAVADLARHRVTGCVFVGMQWDQICDEIVAQGVTLSLRRASWGAANTPVEVLEKLSRTLPGVPVFSFFGQTEMSPVTCALRAEDAERKRGSVGRPIINVEARLVDDEGHDVAQGEVGEIVYRGPTVMAGYWNMPEADAEAFAGGWFHSGDLCRMDDEGYLYVVDRKKDMVISGGENIYSLEVEAVLRAHPAVADVAVIGIPHPVWGETPRAVIVANDPERPPSEEELIAWCREHLASYKKPTSVVFVPELPLNAAGKVVKPALRQRFGDP
jgi:acyl-CoA synthetase (AMP-forming)/AMP-acid ligase II